MPVTFTVSVMNNKILDPRKQKDFSLILELLENGDVSEIEDLNNDEEDVLDTPMSVNKYSRAVGVDAMTRFDEEAAEEETADVDEEVANESQSDEINNYIDIFTEKKQQDCQPRIKLRWERNRRQS
jgi:hypothetical protein